MIRIGTLIFRVKGASRPDVSTSSESVAPSSITALDSNQKPDPSTVADKVYELMKREAELTRLRGESLR